jgi:hypothetical protein
MNIFIGVLSGNSSASIRNLGYLKKHSFDKTFCIRRIVRDRKFPELLSLVYTISIMRLFRSVDLCISTNPKWLVILPIFFVIRFNFFIGDPFIGDISRKDNFFYSLLWRISLILSRRLIVTAPKFAEHLRTTVGRPVELFRRPPFNFPDRPKYANKPGNIVSVAHFGDLNSDRSKFRLIGRDGGEISLTVFSNSPSSNWKYSGNDFWCKRISPNEVVSRALEFDVILIVMNRQSSQIPGKYYDFTHYPGEVVVVHEFENFEDSVDCVPDNYRICKIFGDHSEVVI